MNLEGKFDVLSFLRGPPDQGVLTRLGEGLNTVRTHWLCSPHSSSFAPISGDKWRESYEEGTGRQKDQEGREQCACVCVQVRRRENREKWKS